jgi:hypothetical protein
MVLGGQASSTQNVVNLPGTEVVHVSSCDQPVMGSGVARLRIGGLRLSQMSARTKDAERYQVGACPGTILVPCCGMPIISPTTPERLPHKNKFRKLL